MSLHLLLPLVLIPSLLLGELARRLKLSALVGEILAGVVLGPLVLDLLPTLARDPAGFRDLEELAHIGLCALLFELGLESAVEGRKHSLREGLLAAGTGMAASFGLGFAATSMWGWGPRQAAFVGTVLMSSSVSVVASHLAESRRQEAHEGDVVIAAALISNIAGLVVASVLVTLWSAPEGGEGKGLVVHLVSWAVLLAVVGFVGPFTIRRCVALAAGFRKRSALLILGFSYLLVIAQLAERLGGVMIVGAYAAGLALARIPQSDRLRAEILPLIDVLRPLFFALVGAGIGSSTATAGTAAGWRLPTFALALVVAALAGKLLSPLFLERGLKDRRIVGYGLLPRGGMAFVVAQMGVRAKLLPEEIFSAIAVTAVATITIGSAAFRAAQRRRSRSGRS